MNYDEHMKLLNCLKEIDGYLRLFGYGTEKIWNRIEDNISMLEMVVEDYKNDPENQEEMVTYTSPELNALMQDVEELFDAGLEICRKYRAA